MLIDLHLVLIPTFLFITAVFAAAEASLLSLSRSQLETLREIRPVTYRKIRGLIFEPDSLLSTLIIGNECLSVLTATSVVALLEARLPFSDRLIGMVAVGLSVTLQLTVSEVLPKILAFRLPVLTASFLVYPTSWAHWLLTPVRKIFLLISHFLLRRIGIQPSPPAVVNEKDFLTLVEVGAESGSLDRDEKEMIFNVFHFSDIPVSAIMTPWKEVFRLDAETPVERAIAEVRRHNYSRIPIVDPHSDRVLGVLYSKELLKLLLSVRRPGPDALKQASFPIHIVSTHKKVSKLFREFKQKKVHLALVVDEYGQQLGVVTLEDVLNSLFKTQKKSEVGIK